jgi:hypothetical protein
MSLICDMDRRLYFPSEGRRAEDFFFGPEKFEGLGRLFEPANLGTKGKHATSRPPKPLQLHVTVKNTKTIEFRTKLLLWRIYVSRKNKMCFGVHVECLLFSPDYNKTLKFLDRFFIEASNIRFLGNPSNWNRADTCGRTDRRSQWALFALMRTC